MTGFIARESHWKYCIAIVVSDTELVEGMLMMLVLRQEACQPLIIQWMYWREHMGVADKGLRGQDAGIVKGQEGAGRANH